MGALFNSTNIELAKLEFERDWEEREKKIENDFESLYKEKVNAIQLENEKENKMLIEDIKKEIKATDQEHQAALYREKEKFDHTFQQLEESHREIQRQEKSSYEKKIKEIELARTKKETAIQNESEKQITEWKNRYNNACAERDELHLKYESQITLIKKEYDEKMLQMDVIFKKNLRDRELKLENRISQKEDEYQEKVNLLIKRYEDKLTCSWKTMDENIEALKAQHKHTVENLSTTNKTNEQKWIVQIETVKNEMCELKKGSDATNKKLIEKEIEIESLKKQNQNQKNFTKQLRNCNPLWKGNVLLMQKKNGKKDYKSINNC